MRSIFLILFCLAVGCVTVESTSDFERFPLRFTATQEVNIIHGSDSHSFIANVTRDGELLGVVFIHPAFLTPLLEMKNSGEKILVTWMIDRKKVDSRFDPELIFRSIQKIYQFDVVTHKNFSKTGGVLHVVGEHESVFSKFDKSCPFPLSIVMKFKGENTPKISVYTRELKCGND